jgi:phasin family protein
MEDPDMAKNGNAFPEWDVTKIFGEFNYLPVDFAALAAAQQRNIEAFTALNARAVEGAQALAVRQAEIVRDAFETSAAAARAFSEVDKPEDCWAKQAEYTKSAVTRGLANARELSELATRTANDTAEILSRRLVESMNEVSGMVPTAAPRATAQPAAKKS